MLIPSVNQEPFKELFAKPRLAIILVASILVAALLSGSCVYIYQHRLRANYTQELQGQLDGFRQQLSASQSATTPLVTTSAPVVLPASSPAVTSDWKMYSSSLLGLSFKYPSNWLVDDATPGRIYVKTMVMSGGYDQNTVPPSFEQVYFAYGSFDASQSRETSIAAGKSDWNYVGSSVTVSKITTDALNIRTYSYTTVGGDALEAYFSNSKGTRFLATNSTELSSPVQSDEIVQLKNILATVVVR